jgi:hypothetical protein
MNTVSRKTLLDDAGRVHFLRKQLSTLTADRDKLEQTIQQLERKLEDAEKAFHATCDKLAKAGQNAGDGDVVTPGKLPHRVLSHMHRDQARLYTAAELAADLKIEDVQQVRTALARLVAKRLVRRAGKKGQFTI